MKAIHSPHQVNFFQTGMSKNSWLSIAIFLGLAGVAGCIGLMDCQDRQHRANAAGTTVILPEDTQAAVSALVATDDVQGYPLRLNLVTNDVGKLVGCQATVGSNSIKQQLLTAIAAHFVHVDEACTIRVDDSYEDKLFDAAKFDGMLTVLQGLPDAMLAFNNHELVVSNTTKASADGAVAQENTTDAVVGAASPATFAKFDKVVLVSGADATSTETLKTKLMAFLPQGYQLLVLPSIEANTEINRRNDVALREVIELEKNAQQNVANVRTVDIANALNTQVINFASGKADIPPANQDILARAAKLIAQKANVSIGIKGFTDSTGASEHNMRLSQQRADAVKLFLMAQGIAADKLTTIAMGAKQPVASNTTEEGRLRNRRIEFVIEEINIK